MKVLPGALVTNFSGSAGGQTIQNGRYGFIMRNKPIGTKKSTPAQQIIKGRYQVISHTWGTLPLADRDLWNAAALNWPFTDLFGVTYFLTGFGLYTKLNLVRRMIGLDLLPLPFDPEVVPQPTLFTVAPSGADPWFSITFAPTPMPATVRYQLYATRPMPAGTSVPGNVFKQITYIPESSASPYDSSTAYKDTFGFFPPSGAFIFFRLLPVLLDRGQQGIPLDATLIMP